MTLIHWRIKGKKDINCVNAEVLHNSVGMLLLREVDESVRVVIRVCLWARRQGCHYTYERGHLDLV